jgi:hypothetical protein
MPKLCYLCGTTENLTRDHIPPANLFPDPKPKNLITVDCCKSCNESFSKDDEAFRFWVSTSIFRSGAGDWIWENKVVPSFVTRNKKLVQNARNYISSQKIATPVGDIDAPILNFPRERARRYLTRITKGLLRHFHPDYNYVDKEFSVQFLPQTPHGVDVDQLRRWTDLPTIIYDERGGGVFRFWRGFPPDAPQKGDGAWLYAFYDCACFFVRHSSEALALTNVL